MSDSAKAEAVLALHRFGMGPRPGSIAAIAADPRGALIAELERAPAELVAASALPSSAKAFRTVADANAKRQARLIVATKAKAKEEEKAKEEAKRQQMSEASAAPSMVEAAGQSGAEAAAKTAADAVPDPGRQFYLEEAKIRIGAALDADIGLTERLVWFWSNHFCISADKIQSMSGAYEREAIRPHVLGRFTDLLLAAEGHPAMLFYLDNTVSMGPNSTAGINRSRGLDENFARETLELHTMGVRSGYTQDDVIAFAKVLTGWTLVQPDGTPERGGEFTFNPRLHEPGEQTIMGKVYADEGVEQGRAVLKDLAKHPATATHVASKLARHFVADEPPAALVERMAKVFLDTDGNLRELAKTMVSADESWTQPPAKLKSACEWRVGMFRACGFPEIEPAVFVEGQALLGERLWRPPSPKGYPDDEASWIDSMGRRLDIANKFAERMADKVDPRDVMEDVLGSTVSTEVKQAVGRADSRQQALALLFMSVEFQRR
jgi:uncharacterized protein (DUF1800 family)